LVEQPSKTDLVPFGWKQDVRADDTLREFKQVIRFNFVDMPGVPLRAQILFDRVHKENTKLSKPVGFFRVSDTEELVRLAKNSLASAVILAFFQHSKSRPDAERIHRAVHDILEFNEADVESLVHVMLGEIELHRQARAPDKAIPVPSP